VRRLFLLDIGYRRALEELRSLYAPEAHDPFPRHHQHFGGSLAVTAAAYAKAGGMPLKRSSEDVALHHAIVRSGGKFRHSHRVRVYTSARMIGRAQGGLADAIGWWHARARDGAPVLVESAAAAEARFLMLGFWCRENPGRVPPAALVATPDPPAPGQAAEIHGTLLTLRDQIEALRPLSLAARLEPAARGRRSTGILPIVFGTSCRFPEVDWLGRFCAMESVQGAEDGRGLGRLQGRQSRGAFQGQKTPSENQALFFSTPNCAHNSSRVA